MISGSILMDEFLDTKEKADISPPVEIFEGISSVSAVINACGREGYDRKIIKVLFDREKSDKKRRELDWLKSKAGIPGARLSSAARTR